MSGVRTPSIAPWSADRAVEVARGRGLDGATPLVVVGQCPREHDGAWHERIGVLAPGRRPRLVVDAWMTRANAAGLAARLGTSLGGWDVMFATDWAWAWGGAPFSVWCRRGRVLTVTGPGQVTTRFLLGERSHPVVAVEVALSPDWVTRQVGVRTAGGEAIWIARAREPMATLAPTYDGLDLLADASWAVQLSLALAAALGVPRTCDDALA